PDPQPPPAPGSECAPAVDREDPRGPKTVRDHPSSQDDPLRPPPGAEQAFHTRMPTGAEGGANRVRSCFTAGYMWSPSIQSSRIGWLQSRATSWENARRQSTASATPARRKFSWKSSYEDF